MIKVLIVEDHEIFREGVKKILSDDPDIQIVGEESNGTEMIRRIQELDFDVLLLDLNLPGRNGLELIEEIKRKKPMAHVLVLSINPEEESALHALNAGASGYLCKDAALKEMVSAIRKIYEKGRYLSSTLAEQLAFDLLKPGFGRNRMLSSIESNIANKISNGMPVREIADELGLSVSTVFAHRRKIFEKTGVRNNVELAHFVLENKLTNY